MKQSDFGKLLPYDMEVKLKERGALLKLYDREKKTNYDFIDKNHKLVTASFSGGGSFVADEILKLISKPETA